MGLSSDLKAAREHLTRFACSPEATVEEHAALSVVLTALDQAAEALSEIDRMSFVIEACVRHSEGGEHNNTKDVQAALSKVRAATVYATLKPADTKEGER